jgi:hypothetical protein
MHFPLRTWQALKALPLTASRQAAAICLYVRGAVR